MGHWSHISRCAFVVAAAVFSIFHGWYAVTIHVTGGKLATIFSERRLPPDSRRHWSWWLHQFWINFAGSAIGWAAGYYLIFCRGKIETLTDSFLVIVAMIGVFGFLPWRLFNTALKS